MWGQLLLFLTTVYCLYLFIRLLPARNRDLKIITVSTFLIWLLSQIIYSGEMNFYEDIHHDFIQITIISLILTSELILVRLMRPGVFRYPYFIVFAPLLIPISFILIINTHMIKDIVFMTTQGVAIVVYFLLMFEKQEIKLTSKQAIIGIILMILSFVSFWFVQNIYPLNSIIWESMLAIGSVLIVHSLVNNLQQT